MGREITRCHARPYCADIGTLRNFEAVDHNGIVFAPKQCSYQKVAMGMEHLNMQSLSR